MIIAIDFDGTCVTHEFPKIGKDIGAVPVLNELVKNGHQLILWTVRSDIENPKSEQKEIVPNGGMFLTDAVRWFEENGISLWGINKNPEQKTWSHSQKAYAHLYIDDAALGIPLIYNETISDRPYVDWKTIENILIEKQIIKTKAAQVFNLIGL